MKSRFPMLAVSACLAGVACRYNGEAYSVAALAELVASGDAMPICPERLGGLNTPRNPVEWRDGRVVDAAGNDLTGAFLNGAERAAQIAAAIGCTGAVLKARSPSCGCGCIYDGTFSHRRVTGDGAFCRLLKEAGVQVITEEDDVTAFIDVHCGVNHGDE